MLKWALHTLSECLQKQTKNTYFVLRVIIRTKYYKGCVISTHPLLIHTLASHCLQRNAEPTKLNMPENPKPSYNLPKVY